MQDAAHESSPRDHDPNDRLPARLRRAVRAALSRPWLWNRYVAFFGIFLIYSLTVSSFWFRSRGTQLVTELPLVLGIFIVSEQLLRPSRWRPVLAGLPLAVFYLVHDFYFDMFGGVPEWHQLGLVPQLLDVLSGAESVVLSCIVAVPVLIWLLQVDWRAFATRRIALPVAAVIAVGSFFYSPSVVAGSARAVLSLRHFSHEHNVVWWGRLFMSLLREAERRTAVAQCADYDAVEDTPLHLDAEIEGALNQRNVHVIVMESFLDPRLLEGVQLSRSPFSDDFLALVGDGASGSLAPKFINGTCKSEFEVLCGVPAVGLYGDTELNLFTGAPTYCLPNMLGAAGYATIAHHPYRPGFYNRFRAYPALGFQQALFSERYSRGREPSISDAGATNRHLSDHLLFPQVLERVRPHLEAGQPVLNYILTMYGHHPYLLNGPEQPIVVRVEPHDTKLERLVNQAYYRTEALAQYIQALIREDPDGIIVAVGDHMPPMPGGESDYDRLGYRGRFSGDAPERFHEVFLLVIDRGQVEPVGLLTHWQLQWLILDKLTDGRFCERRDCDVPAARPEARSVEPSVLQSYRTLMGLATRSLD